MTTTCTGRLFRIEVKRGPLVIRIRAGSRQRHSVLGNRENNAASMKIHCGVSDEISASTAGGRRLSSAISSLHRHGLKWHQDAEHEPSLIVTPPMGSIRSKAARCGPLGRARDCLHRAQWFSHSRFTAGIRRQRRVGWFRLDYVPPPGKRLRRTECVCGRWESCIRAQTGGFGVTRLGTLPPARSVAEVCQHNCRAGRYHPCCSAASYARIGE